MTYTSAYKALKEVIDFLEAKGLLLMNYKRQFNAVLNKLALFASQEKKKK